MTSGRESVQDEMQQMQGLPMKRQALLMQFVVLVKPPGLHCQNFCSRRLKLCRRFAQCGETTEQRLVIAFLAGRKLCLAATQFVHMNRKLCGLVEQKLDRVVDFFRGHAFSVRKAKGEGSIPCVPMRGCAKKSPAESAGDFGLIIRLRS